jgi:hypothetical protein
VPLLALAVSLVGFVNARRVARVVKVDVPIAGLPEALHGYSIAQISDIHVGPTIKRAYLNAIVNRVNALGADAIAVTGDLVDGSVQRLALHTQPLARLSAPDGAFFVTGNHEYYSGAEEWIAELRRLGLTVLLNQHVLRERGGASLMIAGVADYSAHHVQSGPPQRSARAMAGAPLDLRRADPAGAPAAQRAGRGRGRVRPAAVGPHPWRPVLPVEPVRAAAAAFRRRAAPGQAAVGVHQPRHRLLGAAEALRRAVRNHSGAPGASGVKTAKSCRMRYRSHPQNHRRTAA